MLNRLETRPEIPTQVDCATAAGPVTSPAVVIGPWAVTNAILAGFVDPHSYRVTHVASGRALPGVKAYSRGHLVDFVHRMPACAFEPGWDEADPGPALPPGTFETLKDYIASVFD